jgi:uncharacterized protein
MVANKITITLAWSPSVANIIVRNLEITHHSTIEQALELAFSQKLELPEDWRTAKVGIGGRLKSRDTVLREGDRIELHRALHVDPKEARRLRAKSNPLKSRLYNK